MWYQKEIFLIFAATTKLICYENVQMVQGAAESLRIHNGDVHHASLLWRAKLE